MIIKRWNAEVATVLSALLLLTQAMPAGAAPRQSSSTATTAQATDIQSTDAENRSAALHYISTPGSTPNEITFYVERLSGVLVADGTLPGTIELLLTNTHIPKPLAQTLVVAHPLVQQIRLSESAWGRESEAQITLTVADRVVAQTIEHADYYEIALSSPADEKAHFTIKLVAEPLPIEVQISEPSLTEIVRTLNAVATAGEPTGWWGAETSPKSASSVSTETLTRVRDTEVRFAAVQESLFAAEGDEAPAPEPGVEAPAAQEPPAPAAEPTPEPPAKREPKSVNSAAANKELSRQMISAGTEIPSDAPVAVQKKAWTGSPLQQPVTLDLRDMDLINAVQILANMADINVIAGTDLVGTVTLNLKNVPLMQAMETALRINGLGIVEEKGIYHIKPYLDAIASQRVTQVIDIKEAKAEEIVTTLKSVVQGSEFESLVSIAFNDTANTVILSGPEDQISPLAVMATRLDVEQATLPTVTLPIKLNYSEPEEMLAAVEGMLTPEIGKVTMDARARVLIVTDIPIVVEQVADLLKQLDTPVKQVAIDAMIVDVTLTDAADTGVDWLISAVQHQSRRDAAGNTGIFTGDLQELSLASDLSIGDAAGLLNFGILSGDIDWRGVIQAEVRNNNSTLLSNPKLITIENQPATITIASEIPYTELTSTEQGGQQTSTEFKPIGTTLEVTPKVTHDNHIIAQINAKESTSSQVVNGVPVEDLRQIDTTPHLASGQTIYVGGLRKNNDTVSIRKVPVLGDVPIVNLLFRSNQRSETVNELLIFLTCSVVEGEPELTDYQKERVEELHSVDVKVSAETALINDTVHPSEFRDPAWKWRANHRPAKVRGE